MGCHLPFVVSKDRGGSWQDRSRLMFPDLTRDDVFRLETRRLWLRWPRVADAAAVVRLAGEKAVAEMTARIPHPYPPGKAELYVLRARQANADGGRLVMAVTLKGNPHGLIGMVGIGPGESEATPTLGYWLGLPWWGQGYATEAARALIDALFSYTEERELVASARVINPGSRRVLEKCGFAYHGSTSSKPAAVFFPSITSASTGGRGRASRRGATPASRRRPCTRRASANSPERSKRRTGE